MAPELHQRRARALPRDLPEAVEAVRRRSWPRSDMIVSPAGLNRAKVFGPAKRHGEFANPPHTRNPVSPILDNVCRQHVRARMGQVATRANACARQRRTSAPSRAGVLIRRAAGLLRRQRCGPVRADDARPASEPLSGAAGRPTEHRVCTPKTTSPAPCTGRLRYRDSHQHPGRCPCARYDRVLTRSRAALGFRGASVT